MVAGDINIQQRQRGTTTSGYVGGRSRVDYHRWWEEVTVLKGGSGGGTLEVVESDMKKQGGGGGMVTRQDIDTEVKIITYLT